MRTQWLSFLAAGLVFLPAWPATAEIFISEIMYHPVELPAFDPNGLPLLDLSDDVYEFVELHNAGANSVNLEGWSLAGGIAFDFPAGTMIAGGGFVVIAKDPARLAAVAQYGLTTNQILGPYSGQLGNSGDTIRLHAATDDVVDSVSYSRSFPWAIGADALGADDEWTGLNSSSYQHRGRSLERVSFNHSANDPANWLASPLATGPTPGRTNSIQLNVPRPIVIAVSVVQASNGETLIRASQPVRLEVMFSATNQLSNISVEYFVDNINLTNEVRSTLALAALGNPSEGRFTATLPGQLDRSVVRYRIRADRGAGLETVSPRADDPFLWHAYFVTPQRTSNNPIYDVFISSVSLTALTTNISQSPRRVTLPDPPGTPRPSWNATEPAIFVYNGAVYDIRMRHHGSRYRRDPARRSYKYQFPSYAPFNGRTSFFETDKGEEHRLGSKLYDAVDLPVWRCRYVDIFQNSDGLLTRLEQEEMDSDLYQRWIEEQTAKFPDAPKQHVGDFYKSEGVVPYETATGQGTAPTYEGSGEGPYYIGNCAPIPLKTGWSLPQRYDWTYPIQMHAWKAGVEMQQLITGLWAARGDSPTAPNPNLADLRLFLQANFDVDTSLTYIAIRNWSSPFDDATQNYFLWRKGDGRWALLPWDLDAEFNNSTQSIYWDEQAVPQPDTLRGPHWLKDSFLKAFRNEYKQKLFVLNHTWLAPANLTANGLGGLTGYANLRQANVDTQLGLGVWYAPLQPFNLAPGANGATFPPAVLQASTYLHSDTNSPAHASTTWIIRRATGGYTNPVVRTTSNTNLISLPIPFEQLTFGETYFWKCFYTDTNGHPSPDSVETSFVFGAAPAVTALVPIDAGTRWRYNASGTNPPANWNQPGFDDSAWPQGAPLFADETSPLPEPIRTPLVHSNYISFYFRTSFVFPGSTSGVGLRIRQIIDDGVVVYLNGVEVSRTGMPSGTVNNATLANRGVGEAVYEGPFNISTANLIPGMNVLTAEVHQNAATSSDVVFGLSLEATVPAGLGNLQLSEVMADNRGSVTNGLTAPDFIELYNASDLPQDLGQMSLSDNPERPGKFVFPSGTVISPRGFFTVWCDDATNAPGLHAGFALDNDGQTVALFAVTPHGYQLADSVTFGLQVPDHSLGRVNGSWVLNTPTPNTTNLAVALGSAASLKINEWMAISTTGPDWFELFNSEALPVALGGLHLSDSMANRTNTRIAALSFLGPRDFRQFIADQDLAEGARHVNFRLSANGESIVITDTNLVLIDSITFGPQAADVSEGRLPDGAANIVAFPGSASPEAWNYLRIANIVINELMPDIELYNPTLASVDVSGWWLSDDPATLHKYRIPDGTLLLPGGYWWVDDDELPFRLDQLRGGHVILSHEDIYRTSAKFGPFDGHTYGTVPTSSGVDFVRLRDYTFGTLNGPPEVGPVVISEIQYHPPDLPGDDDDYEFIELANIASSPVAMFDQANPANRWRLRDAVSFTFPTNTTLAAAERVLVLPFDPATNAAALSNFMAVYDVPSAVRLFGPYSGKLDNAGDSVELVKPGAPITGPGPDYGSVPDILIDRVNYTDGLPWPTGADGTGASLQRRVLSQYGNEPTNWFASGVSPGVSNTTNIPPTLVFTTPTNGARINFGLAIPLTVNAGDSDGFVRKVEFFADDVRLGQISTGASTFIWSNAPAGPHTVTARATDNRLGMTASGPINFTVVNLPPFVEITTPSDRSFITLPTNILVQATAGDPDGVLVKVQFFANGARLGEVLSEPYSLTWTNPRSGIYTLTAVAIDDAGAATTSAPVHVTASREVTIAYVVATNTVGTQTLPNPYGLGMDFNVLSPVVVTRLGTFDSGSDGINASSTLTTQIYNRNGPTPLVVASLTFSTSDPGVLIGGSRFKALAAPVVLSNGLYSVVAYGYDGNNRDANIGTGNVKTWETDDGGGLLAFVGGGRYGAVTPGSFPATLDGGPADRYGAGTFEFRAAPVFPTIFGPPTNTLVRPGSNATFSVTAVGQAPLFYRWLFNGAPIASATTSTLIISNTQVSHLGNYQVVVTNVLGSATSSPATLSFLIEPIIVQPPLSQSVVTGATVTLSVSVTNTANLPIGYRWRRNGVFINNAFFILNQHTAFFTVTNAQLPFTNYQVVVTNIAKPGGNLSTNAFLTFVADTDGDGLPDSWESAFGLDPNSALDRDVDSDGDGMKNWQEYIAGTDPTDPLSYLKIEAVAAGVGAAISYVALSNKTYTVQYTDAFGSDPWSRLTDAPARATNRLEVVDDPGFTTNRFYRLVTPQQP